MSIVIAIDGPAGTGKSTVSRAVAAKLGLEYFDTGATYRVAALHCLREGVNLKNDEDVSRLLHTDTISLIVSDVATNLEARAVLGHMQRRLIAASRKGAGMVVEGRDITTIIAPEAEVRVLLTADDEVRVARRAGDGADPVTVLEAVPGTDRKDATVVEFHKAADAVVLIDTTDL